jgi:hypothetical protein
MLTEDMEYPKIGIHKPGPKYKRDYFLMRLINKRIYQLTGNDMYLWLGGDFNELNKIEDGQNRN